METPKFQPGDKAIIRTEFGKGDSLIFCKKNTSDEWEVDCKILVGTVVEITGSRVSKFRKDTLLYDFIHPLYGKRAADERFLAPYTEQQHVCNCPRENFSWNGRGCVCGGK